MVLNRKDKLEYIEKYGGYFEEMGKYYDMGAFKTRDMYWKVLRSLLKNYFDMHEDTGCSSNWEKEELVERIKLVHNGLVEFDMGIEKMRKEV